MNKSRLFNDKLLFWLPHTTKGAHGRAISMIAYCRALIAMATAAAAAARHVLPAARPPYLQTNCFSLHAPLQTGGKGPSPLSENCFKPFLVINFEPISDTLTHTLIF
jgi:hypothetical protein